MTMGVDLYIGEAVIHTPDHVLDYPNDHHRLEVWVAEREGYVNHWKMSYSGFGEFLKNAGLDDLMWMYEGAPVCGHHPGCDWLTPRILERFRQAKVLLEQQNPRKPFHVETINWLVTQTEWALTNCKIPALMNR